MTSNTFCSVLVLMGLIGFSSVSRASESGWTRKANMPTARVALCACVVDGKIYAIGGAPRYQVVTPIVEQYDPVTDTWTPKAGMRTARAFFGASVVNGRIYVVGGSAGPAHLSSCEEYDPVANTWTDRASMPTARAHLSAVAVGSKLYAIGGLTKSSSQALRVVEEYDPIADAWTRKTDMPAGSGTVFCSAIDGIVYFPGGGPTGGQGTDQAVRTVQAYDPAADAWTTLAQMLTARAFFPTCAMNGKLYAIGGCQNAYNSSELLSMEAYDPATDTWWRMAPMQVKRKALAAAVVNGKIYAIGGVSQGGWEPTLSTVEEYDPTPTVSIVPSGLILKIFWNGILESNDTLDGLSWQDVNPPAYPWLVNPNSAGAMKFYRARGL